MTRDRRHRCGPRLANSGYPDRHITGKNGPKVMAAPQPERLLPHLSPNDHETVMSRISRRHALIAGGAATALSAFPRFAIGEADTRPSITIAVQKISNSNTLDTMRERSNVGERIFCTHLWEPLIGRNWRGKVEGMPALATEGA
jgi:hypothetical protein